ncbi:MAG: bifunctional 5,10-methylene-tetrahydrofolate dehydrogenase/5,10-methylene-tetrahydrofolate cyclohydrolase [Erysipelotrichaceae bacterium]|nr:bifunctional 5,10-methylene-tetrahydrofolate dehydrogenase/5,10-methylene-tetrahydrofolate cyclohydrolase [Erysipelotrichaceae bacterium]
MANILYGAPVAQAINERTAGIVRKLAAVNIVPTLAIVRLGENADDIAYEKGAIKRCESLGMKVITVTMKDDVSAEEFCERLKTLNDDPAIHGILLFRPLPWHINEDTARNLISPQKDLDGCCDLSLAALLTGKGDGFAPATAQAVVEMLEYYQIPVKGARTAVLGRSLVIGKPVALLLLNRHATVTICHTRTANLQEICRESDIIVAATGQMESLNRRYFRAGQTVIDVGISYNEKKQKLCGDVLYEEVEPLVDNITPVPKGVGSVTTAVLANHLALAAERTISHE